MNGRTKIAVRALLVCLGLAMGLGVAEISMRWMKKPAPGSEFESLEDLRAAMRSDAPHAKKADGSVPFVDIIRENPDDRIIYELRPNLQALFTGVPVRTNSQGMRAEEVPSAKSAGEYRIALLGDSFAFGWGVLEDQAFGAAMERSLNSAGKGKYRVLNFGVPGYSTFQEVAVFESKGLAFEPDAVLVFFIDNDFGFPFFIRSLDGKNDSSGFALSRITSRAFTPERMLQELRSKGLDPNTVLARLDDLCASRGISLYLAINPRKEWRELYNKLTVLRDHPRIRFLDIAPSFDRIVEQHGYQQADLNLPNDPHPTALRHGIYGELLAQQMRRFMPSEEKQ